MSFVPISDLKIGTSPPSKPKFALFALAFRPFYLLAALFAVLSILVWLLFYVHQIPLNIEFPNLSWGFTWHAHEMIFGFALAVIVGFLFTAGKNWTGIQTPHGWNLGILCLLWIFARGANLIASQEIALISDAVFEISAVVLLARVFFKAKSKRNYKFLTILVVFTLLDAATHLALLGEIPVDVMTPIYLALYVVILVVCIMATRVVPMFTNNAFPNARVSNPPKYVKAAIGGYIVAMLSLFLPLPIMLQAALLVLAGVFQAALLFKWRGYKTFSKPIVWILHVSYLWIVVGLFLHAAALYDLTTLSIARHAMAVGAMSGMILGMITRTALGHTGAPLQVGKSETIAYILLQLGAFFRVLMPILLPHVKYNIWMDIAALCWMLAFTLYLIKYTPKLIRSRLDGKEG